MAFGVVAILLGLVGLPFYLKRYKVEGLAAMCINGLPVFYALAFFTGIGVTTVGTGAYFFVTGALATAIWMFHHRRDSYSELPKRLSAAPMALVLLFFMWLAHHIYERNVTLVTNKEEYYRWAYYIVNWFMALIMGFVFPLSMERVQRFLRAVAILGLTSSAIMVIGYVVGLEDVSKSYGARYAISEQLTDLNYAVCASTSMGALLGGYLICQGRLTGRRIAFVIAGAMLLLAAVILGGTRSSMLVILACGLAVMGVFRLRYIPIAVGGAAVAAVIAIFAVIPLLPEGGVKRTMSPDVLAAGFGNRFRLLMESFSILEVAPAFGKTVGLRDVIGATYSHNFTSQVLVETGLIGITLYLLAVIAIAVKWGKMLVHKQSPLFAIGAPLLMLMVPVFIEAHAHGSLRNGGLWMLLGLMAAHRLEGPLAEHATEEELLQEQADLQLVTAGA